MRYCTERAYVLFIFLPRLRKSSLIYAVCSMWCEMLWWRPGRPPARHSAAWGSTSLSWQVPIGSMLLLFVSRCHRSSAGATMRLQRSLTGMLDYAYIKRLTKPYLKVHGTRRWWRQRGWRFSMGSSLNGDFEVTAVGDRLLRRCYCSRLELLVPRSQELEMQCTPQCITNFGQLCSSFLWFMRGTCFILRNATHHLSLHCAFNKFVTETTIVRFEVSSEQIDAFVQDGKGRGRPVLYQAI